MLKPVDKEMIAVMNSCVEGLIGEWGCSTAEGREAFEAMHNDLMIVAKRYGINIKGAKEI
jgi:hypothetical protein